MATRDIYETGFDEDVQTNSSTNPCPECDGQVTTNAVETICEDCGLVIDEQRIDHGQNGELTIRTSESGRGLH